MVCILFDTVKYAIRKSQQELETRGNSLCYQYIYKLQVGTKYTKPQRLKTNFNELKNKEQKKEDNSPTYSRVPKYFNQTFFYFLYCALSLLLVGEWTRAT